MDFLNYRSVKPENGHAQPGSEVWLSLYTVIAQDLVSR